MEEPKSSPTVVEGKNPAAIRGEETSGGITTGGLEEGVEFGTILTVGFFFRF